VLRILSFTLFFITSLYAQKVLYVNYDTTPKRVIQGEIFQITLKTVPTIKDFDNITYTFSNHPGIKILDDAPQREIKGNFYYDSFHMLATSRYAKLPDVEAKLIASQEYNSTKIPGEKLNVIKLNPKRNFSNIIADSVELQEYKTTAYDTEHNIVIFILKASNANLKAMHFKNIYKEGIESVNDSYDEAKITYYVVIDKRLESFTFSYFNLLKNNYETISIPIIVDDDSVTTQSDLKPRDQSHDTLKMYIALGIALFGFLFIILRQKYIYLVLIILPLAYVLYLNMPQKEICIKAGSNIYILPVNNGTVFETTKSKQFLFKEGSVKNFTKVKLHNEKIGWVKNEDTCTY